MSGAANVTTKLKLSIATGNYDRTRPMVDGDVPIDGVDPIFMLLSPEEMFFRSFRDKAFEVSELSLSSFAVKTAAGNNPYVGVPVFPSRAFRHTSICIRTDRGIERPEDLRGRRIGTPEYQLTACVWVRALLEEEYGVKPSDVTWVRGGLEELGRPEKIAVKLPPEIAIEQALDDKTLAQMLKDGDIDAIVAPRAVVFRAMGSERRMAVARPAEGGERVFSEDPDLPDHASDRHPQGTRRGACLAADGHFQGLL